MSTYKLVVIDDHHLILTTTRLLSPQDTQMLRVAFERWQKNGGAAVIADCEVVRGATITIELPDDDDEVIELVPHG